MEGTHLNYLAPEQAPTKVRCLLPREHSPIQGTHKYFLLEKEMPGHTPSTQRTAPRTPQHPSSTKRPPPVPQGIHLPPRDTHIPHPITQGTHLHALLILCLQRTWGGGDSIQAGPSLHPLRDEVVQRPQRGQHSGVFPQVIHGHFAFGGRQGRGDREPLQVP